MIGKPGDRPIIKRLSTTAPSRDGQILEVHGIDGAPPYLVQWSDDGQIGLFRRIIPGLATSDQKKRRLPPRFSWSAVEDGRLYWISERVLDNLCPLVARKTSGRP